MWDAIDRKHLFFPEQVGFRASWMTIIMGNVLYRKKAPSRGHPYKKQLKPIRYSLNRLTATFRRSEYNCLRRACDMHITLVSRDRRFQIYRT